MIWTVILERSSHALAWVLLTLAAPPTMFTLLYVLSAFEPKTTGDARTAETVFSLLSILFLAGLWWPGLCVLGRLRKALADRARLTSRTWFWAGVFNLLMLTLAIVIPVAADWNSGGVNVGLVLIVFGLPALLTTQVVIAGFGWWQARRPVE